MEHSKEKNNTQQAHISSIYSEFTNDTRVLRSFTNLSNTVIQTALSGQSKFIFEILQNADDAFEDVNKAIGIKFILHGNYLIVQHNGKGFDYYDVERICDYASQIEDVKANDLSKTGYKGLGFKSLFYLSDCIYIYSNGYSFRFDKNSCPDSENKPWQVVPIWCEYDKIPLAKIYPYDQPVNFILCVKDVNQLENQLRELIKQPDLLLYLHRISKLSVNLNDEKYFLERKMETFGVFHKVDFYKNGDVESTWLSRTYKRSVPKEVQILIQGASRFIYPDKIKNAKDVYFTFALRTDETLKKISWTRGLCYSTLPTQLHLELPYHVNSFFILNLDRTQLHENEWNAFLIFQLGILQFYLLRDLAEVKYLKNYVINLFVRKINHTYNTFNKAFMNGFSEACGKIGWLPSHKGQQLLKLGEAWTDEIEFFKQEFQSIRDHRIYPYIINYDVIDQHLLYSSEGEVKYFTYDQLFKDFPNRYYPQLTIDAYSKFINYLYERLKGPPFNNKVITKLKNVYFLVTKDESLVTPKNALIEENDNPIPDFLMLNPINNEYLPSGNIDSIKDWLAHLGARRLTPAQILRESILKWMDSGNFECNLNKKNHIGIVNYILDSHEHLTQKELEKIREKLFIQTENGEFKLAKLCYLPNAVPIEELSDIILVDEKVSSCYNMDHLVKFFQKIGICESLSPIDVLRKSILTWIKNNEINEKLTMKNYMPIIDYVAQHYSMKMVEYKLTDIEKAELKKMPVLTCGQIFQKAQSCFFDTAIPTIKGLEGIIARNKLVYTKNIPNHVTKFLAKIGVSKNISSIDLIRRSVLKWIQEGEIRNRITWNNHCDILSYIAKEWHSLESGLKPKEKKDLKKFPILTESREFRAAQNCYWPNSEGCEEIPGIEYVISSNEFVSSEYSKAIKNILQDLGVRKVTFTDIYEKYSDHLINCANLKWFFSKLISYWKKNKMSNNDILLNYLFEKFTTESCLLGKNGKSYRSIDLYSLQFNNIHDIDPNSVPLLEYEKVPEDLEKYLGFRTELDLKCIKQLLKAVEKRPKLGEERTLIFFTTLLEQLRLKNRNEIRRYELGLLSQENKLKPAKDLYYFFEEDATCCLDSLYLKRIPHMSHNDTLNLAELCGVNLLPFKEEFKLAKETSDDSLKEFYLNRLPFIVIQESRMLNEEPNITLKHLYNLICTLELYQCSHIEVQYSFGSPVKIKEHFKGLTLYVAGKWIKKRSTIHSHLRLQLGFKTDIRDVIDMEDPISFSDKLEWLSDHKEDLQKFNLIEKELEKLLSCKGKKDLDALPSFESVNVEDICDFSDEVSSVESSIDSDDTELDELDVEPYLKTQQVIKDVCKHAYPDIAPLDTKTTADNNIATVDKTSVGNILNDIDWPSLCELEIDHKIQIQQPEILDNHHPLTDNIHIGSARLLPDVTSGKPYVKWLSEKYVFNFLQEYYKNKYPNSCYHLTRGVFMLQWQSLKIEIAWLNVNGDKGHLYDLLLKKGGEVKQVIEVKSTTNVANNGLLNLRHDKFIEKINQLAIEFPKHKQNYCIYRVFHGDDTSVASIEELNSTATLYKVLPLKKPLNFSTIA